ncbi:hypothetical protein [Novosphingobium huizhouense]|uniref:hypothetical protein n=1 Tax=Novosphingobium huizhouense TaxID=2866625 RepID=UPI001CD8CD32|nr:hypothetical protein [Novosphingobium huizhouense]
MPRSPSLPGADPHATRLVVTALLALALSLPALAAPGLPAERIAPAPPPELA